MPRFTIATEQAGQRIDHVLAERSDVVSRSAAQRLIAEGQVSLNDKAPSKHQTVRGGDVVAYHLPAPRESNVQPEPIDIAVRYEDADIAVISKPAGLVVHPAHGHDHGTLVNALLYHMRDLSGVGGERRPGIVHRLDKDTSGLMLVAKNDAAHVRLARQLGRRRIKRTYVALVHGQMPLDEGTIDAPIGRSLRDRRKMAVVAGGRQARTHFRVRERLDNYALVDLSLETGRTHQIRVHMAHVGHPVVGDIQYGPAKKAHDLGLDRQFLHAVRLEFVHPRTGEATAVADPLPHELAEALARTSCSAHTKALLIAGLHE